jgi:ketosteroid isomerase-like protein
VAGEELVRRLYTAVDAGDIEGYLSQLTPDVWFRFGNQPPVVGRAALRAALEQFYAGLTTLSHANTGVWRVDDTIIVEADVTYTRLNGSTITLPAVTVYRLQGDQGQRVQVFMDIAPAFVND